MLIYTVLVVVVAAVWIVTAVRGVAAVQAKLNNALNCAAPASTRGLRVFAICLAFCLGH